MSLSHHVGVGARKWASATEPFIYDDTQGVLISGGCWVTPQPLFGGDIVDGTDNGLWCSRQAQ